MQNHKGWLNIVFINIAITELIIIVTNSHLNNIFLDIDLKKIQIIKTILESIKIIILPLLIISVTWSNSTLSKSSSKSKISSLASPINHSFSKNLAILATICLLVTLFIPGNIIIVSKPISIAPSLWFCISMALYYTAILIRSLDKNNLSLLDNSIQISSLYILSFIFFLSNIEAHKSFGYHQLKLHYSILLKDSLVMISNMIILQTIIFTLKNTPKNFFNNVVRLAIILSYFVNIIGFLICKIWYNVEFYNSYYRIYFLAVMGLLILYYLYCRAIFNILPLIIISHEIIYSGSYLTYSMALQLIFYKNINIKRFSYVINTYALGVLAYIIFAKNNSLILLSTSILSLIICFMSLYNRQKC